MECYAEYTNGNGSSSSVFNFHGKNSKGIFWGENIAFILSVLCLKMGRTQDILSFSFVTSYEAIIYGFLNEILLSFFFTYFPYFLCEFITFIMGNIWYTFTFNVFVFIFKMFLPNSKKLGLAFLNLVWQSLPFTWSTWSI